MLARFARHISRHGLGLGPLMMGHVFGMVQQVASTVGVAAVVLDPLTESAKSFYTGFGFEPFGGNGPHGARMYLNVADIR
jgi:predicted GNAT superfamily acetyltransferase